MEMKKAFLNILNYAIADAHGWFNGLWSGFIAASSIAGGVLLALIQKYLVRDLAFIPWLVLVVTLDTITGYQLARKKWKDDPVLNQKPTGQTLREKLGGKSLAIVVTLVLLNVITNYEISGLPAQQAFVNIPLFGYRLDLNVFKAIYFSGATYMIFAEAKSTIRNMRQLGYNLFPKKLDDTLDKFTGENEGNNV